MVQNSYSGVPGILRPFKEFLEGLSLSPGAEVIFYGVPGTCTPFVELLCYATRSLPCSFIYVPYLSEAKAHRLIFNNEGWYQIGEPTEVKSPAVVVVMGGLAMPNMPVSLDEISGMTSRNCGAKIIGVCFMHMFEKAGWIPRIKFDLLIDADIQILVTRPD